MANAGVLKGKKATVAGTQAKLIEAKGAQYTGPGVTVDGNVVTGNAPKASRSSGTNRGIRGVARGGSLGGVRLPPSVPELPVADVQQAAKSYARDMGFTLDWVYEDLLAGISRDDARIFLRRRAPEEAKDRFSVTVWLNMASAAEVDELFAEWKDRGVLMVDELKTANYHLREFTAQDVDGNRLRVFHDLGSAPA